MAGFNTINAYDADCRIPAFLGLRQYGDLINGDPRYATVAENMDTVGGVLQPFAKCKRMAAGFEDKIETLMWFYRRWTDDEQKEVLVAAVDGRIRYWDGDAWQFADMPVDFEGDRFECNVWSWATYEINPGAYTYDETATYQVGDYCTYVGKPYRCIESIATAEEWTPAHWTVADLSTVDVLLFSNATDGMFMLRGDSLQIEAIPTPYKFGVITRYAERIWGGAIEGDPDTLAYSAPYDPRDWMTRVIDPSTITNPDWEKEGQPEDGAGDIRQPSWDGDAFTALRQFGASLVAFKRTKVWRVLGTDPGEYAFKEQYGGGTPFAATVAVDAQRIFMLGRQGVEIYDGDTVAPYQQEMCKEIWARLNQEAMDQCCACLWRQKYYIAIPIDGSEICNAILTYSLTDGTWLLRTDMSVESWMPTEEHLYFTSSTTPGFVWEYFEDAWARGEASEAGGHWVTPWNDLNYQDMRKGPFRIYFTPEVQDKPVDLTITLDTDRKRTQKTVRIQPLLDIEQYYHRDFKRVCVHIPGGGRRFRLMITSGPNSPVWRLTGGIKTVADITGD